MKKALFIFALIFFVIGCSALPNTPQSNIKDASSTQSIISTVSEPVLTGIDLYMKCFNEGKYDVYKLKLGDPIQKAIDEFGPGKQSGYGLGAVCYDFGNIIVSFGDSTNIVSGFDIVGDGITVYNLTTGLSTVEEVKKVFGEPEAEYMTGHYSYESNKTLEDPIDEGEKYYFIQYSNNNKDFDCVIDFFFEYGILKVISLIKTGGSD